MSSNSQPTVGPIERGKRLATVMSMQVGYSNAKQALEEHDWNVEEAVAAVSASCSKQEEAATTPSETSPHNNENSHTKVTSLKKVSPHSMKQHDDTALSVKYEDDDDDMDHIPLDEEQAPPPVAGNMEKYIQKQEDEAFRNYPSIVSTGTSRAWWNDPDDATVESYIANVPELLNSTPAHQPSVVSAVTYPREPATRNELTEIPLGEEDVEKSAAKKSCGWKQLLTSRWVWVAIVLLVILVAAVGIGVGQSRSNNNSESLVSGTGDSSSSTTTLQPSTTLAPPISLTTIAGTTIAASTTQLRTTPTTAETPTTATTLPLTTTTTEPPRPVTQDPTTPTTTEPTSPPTESMTVEGAEMTLRGLSSSLDQAAANAWIDVTKEFILNHVQQVLSDKAHDQWSVNVQVALTSQTEGNNRLNIVFSVTFEIESTLTSHNVNRYVRQALGRKNEAEYIQKLQDANSSFQNVSNVNVDT